MSIGSSSSRLTSFASRKLQVRCMSATAPALYPRLTSNRFSPPQSYVNPPTEPSTSASSSRPGKVRFPTNSYDGPDYDPRSALKAARERAWYIEEEDEPVASGTGAESGPRQPRFVTFDPERTTVETERRSVKAFPDYAPKELRPLYEWMVSDEAAHVLDVSSVRFFSTSAASRDSLGQGELVDVPGGNVGARWDWIVIGTVKGRGKGIVGRAERALRLWLHNNPLANTPPRPTGTSNKLPRVPDWTDWSMVQIPHLSISINLFTAEGRDRWDLDGMWGEPDKELLIGKRNRPFGVRPTFE